MKQFYGFGKLIRIKEIYRENIISFLSLVKCYYNLPDEALIGMFIESLDVYETVCQLLSKMFLM